MNLGEEKYMKYTLVKRMKETVYVVKNFNPSFFKPFAEHISKKKALFTTGEVSMVS